MSKKALIIGHSGQDGFYLTEYLESLQYTVYGIAEDAYYNLEKYNLPEGNITEESFCEHLIGALLPDEVYYLAALHQSSVEKSFDDLFFYKNTINVNSYGLLNLLHSITRYQKSCRVFYASSSHIFGGTETYVQNEHTPICPISIYGISKVMGMQFCDLYRKKGIFCSVGIFYNHESPRRPSKFVSKKIVETAVAIRKGDCNELIMGDLHAKVDWGYAPDYVRAAHAILQVEESGSFVIASGVLHSIKDFIIQTFNILDLDWTKYVATKSDIILKKSVGVLQGDTSKLKKITGWKPSVSFNEMIHILVQSELKEKGN